MLIGGRGHHSSTPAACGIAVMAKASAPGRTKTRLVPPLRATEAADLNTAFLRDIVGNLGRAGRDAQIAPYIAFGPRGAEAFFHEWLPAAIPLIECDLPKFGDCLHRAISSVLHAGHAAACVVNSDSPTLPTRLLVQAARVLAQSSDSAVLGPSTDGGYYLLGVHQAHRRLFEDIEWSTPRVFEQTMQRCRDLGLSVTNLEPWYDVDDADGLRRLHKDLTANDQQISSTGLYEAPYTRAALIALQQHLEGMFRSSVVAEGNA